MTPSPEIIKINQPSELLSVDNNRKAKFQLTVNNKTLDSSEPSSSTGPSISSQCSSISDGESYECFGENDQMSTSNELENSSGVDLDLALQTNDAEKPAITRQSWARTSLRGLRGSMKRPLGSNVLANHLYRSSSFNSSGRSSNCDMTEDMYSDVSLEEVQDLNHKLELLQRQITTLADTQMNSDDRTIRAKTENAVLQTKYEILEEQLRETEMRSEERLAEEQKRYRELIARVEREAELRNENAQIRICTAEAESASLREEIQRLKIQCDKQSKELALCEEKLDNYKFNLTIAQENLSESKEAEKRYLHEKQHSEQLITELQKEIELIRAQVMASVKSSKSNGYHRQISASSLSLESNTSSDMYRTEEFHNDMKEQLDELKQQNNVLKDANEELQAMLLNKNIEEGRNLLTGGTSIANLADELKEMGQNQDEALMNSLSQLQSAYQEKDDECRRLKRYIDTILLNIVENHPQLLEIKSSSSQL
ncbi:CLUMA_CG003396, isoform A [Clunio marinus]|uniref:CLUMA_CG003396, isoform A n=1 Tax=Clunio marinus TaxID=568069 RepID=A0A1J1HP13_9DIPT|nr:CLUMA_CG003396, isoform A [Clunio marinus]